MRSSVRRRKPRGRADVSHGDRVRDLPGQGLPKALQGSRQRRQADVQAEVGEALAVQEYCMQGVQVIRGNGIRNVQR